MRAAVLSCVGRYTGVHYDAVVSVYLAALFVQEGRASAQQTVCFLVVAGLMK